jgi:hypothetical protein
LSKCKKTWRIKFGKNKLRMKLYKKKFKKFSQAKQIKIKRMRTNLKDEKISWG